MSSRRNDGVATKALQPEQERLRLLAELLAQFVAGAHIGMMTWWLYNRKQYSTETMAQIGGISDVRLAVGNAFG